MRLIDADKLIDDIDEEIEYGTERIEKHFGDEDKYITKGLRIARKDILMQPTIDAAPIKHGRWISVIAENYECSECKAALWTRKVYPISNYKYCWRCGARMDGENNANHS
jgi:hypothetical protein